MGDFGTLNVSVVALPDAGVATMFGIFDVLNAFTTMPIAGAGPTPPFRAEIVGAQAGPLTVISGIPVPVSRPIDELAHTDIVIVPSIVLGVLMALLGIGRFGISDDDPYAFALGIAWVLIGVMSLVLGLLGLVIERLPAPIHGPYLDPRTFPWPEQVEYGPIPPGWYPAPSKRIPRWWSGARPRATI